MNNLKLYSKLFNKDDYSNYIDYSNNNYDYNLLTKKKKIIVNSYNSPINYYFHLIKNYIKSNEFLSFKEYKDDDIVKFLIEIDKYGKLNSINNDLLYVASELLYTSEYFFDIIKILLIPNEYKKDNIYMYYYLKDYNLDVYNETNKKIYDKYIKKDIERSAFKDEFINNSNFYSVDQDIQDAVWVMIIYCFDKNPVVDKKELKEYLIDFMNHPNTFYNDYYLNGIEYLDDAYPDARTTEEKNLFYRYIEHFFDTRNNYRKRRIR